MIDFKDRIKIKCPKCKKLICTIEINANTEGIYFWCSRCKEEFEIKRKELIRSQ